jgi:hypothetical protein
MEKNGEIPGLGKGAAAGFERRRRRNEEMKGG